MSVLEFQGDPGDECLEEGGPDYLAPTGSLGRGHTKHIDGFHAAAVVGNTEPLPPKDWDAAWARVCDRHI